MKSMGGALSKPVILAIDWHDEMYYGDPDDSDGVIGTQPKKGSHYAYRYSTASVLIDGERITVAVKPIVKGTLLVEQVKDLLNCVQFEHKIKVKLVLLDRGYFSADLLRYLNSTGIDYIMQVPNFYHFTEEEDIPTFTTSSHRRKKEEQATFRLVVVKEEDHDDDDDDDKLYLFATNNKQMSPKRMRKLFRKRWGIETSYRMIRKFLARTTSKIYQLRMFYFYFAIMLYNLWVMMNYLICLSSSMPVEQVKANAIVTIVTTTPCLSDDMKKKR
jgi:hypothetical protein